MPPASSDVWKHFTKSALLKFDTWQLLFVIVVVFNLKVLVETRKKPTSHYRAYVRSNDMN